MCRSVLKNLKRCKSLSFKKKNVLLKQNIPSANMEALAFITSHLQARGSSCSNPHVAASFVIDSIEASKGHLKTRFFSTSAVILCHVNITVIILDSCAFRVNHLHYQPDEYEEDPELVGYEDGDYEHDYHSDSR